MKLLNSPLFLFVVGVGSLAADNKAIQSALLDDRVVYTVPVGTNRVTTVSFPGAIAAIDGAGVSMDSKTAGQFQLAHTRGSAFFSLRALVPKATANLNIRWNNRTYVFELVESAAPVLSLILEMPRPPTHPGDTAPELTPAKLLALLDKVKAFPLLKQQHSDVVSDVEFVTYAAKPSVSDFNDYEIRLEEAYRFNTADTLVFRSVLKNKTAELIHYRPGSFALRVGNRVYPQSVSDAPGVIPPNGESTVYFAVTGTPDGGRNEISLKNNFSVLIERITTEKPVTTREQGSVGPPPELSPARLRSLLDKAEAFPLLQRHHLDVVADIELVPCAEKPSVSDFNDYEIRLEEAYRLKAEGALVFRTVLKNKTGGLIHYRPDSFALRVGDRLYCQSVSDASGLILPNSESTVYFAIAATPDGGWNELSNISGVLIERYPSEPSPQ